MKNEVWRAHSWKFNEILPFFRMMNIINCEFCEAIKSEFAMKNRETSVKNISISLLVE